MRVTKLTLAVLVAAGAVFTSCSSDDDNNDIVNTALEGATPELTDIITGEFSRANTGTYISAYETLFTREGESTVSFSGQTARLKMTKEISSDLKDFDETSTAIQSRFEFGTGFDNTELDEAGKIVRDKTSSSLGLFGDDKNNSGQGSVNLELIEDFIIGFDAVKSASTTKATAGQAGFLTEEGGTTRYVDANGYELDQSFTKSMAGALAYDQTVNHYMNRLDDDKFDGSDSFRELNDAGTVAEGKSYTTMEHHWDEAFGYIYGNIEEENLIYKYIDNVDGLDFFTNFEAGILEAFILGRIAIVNKDYDKRDEYVASLREDLSTVIAVRAVNYIVEGANLLDDKGVADASHDLSEGYGFVNSLRYIVDADGTSIFSDADVDAFLAVLDNDQSSTNSNELRASLTIAQGLWGLNPTTLIEQIAKPIAAEFEWEVSDVKTVEIQSQSLD